MEKLGDSQIIFLITLQFAIGEPLSLPPSQAL